MDRDEALAKLQSTERDILFDLADFCNSHNIAWFMDSGTVLGAMRHGGFIPWDDDIDIGMFREDYDRFLDIAENEGLPSGLSLHTFDNTTGNACLFTKIYRDGTLFLTPETADAGCRQGIFVDIFPYDRLASNEVSRRRQIMNAQLWKNISYLYHSSIVSTLPKSGLIGMFATSVCRFIHWVLKHIVKRADIQKHFERSHTVLMPDGDVGCGRRIVFVWNSRLEFEEADLLPVAQVEFCGRDMPVPGNVLKYLEQCYGDWRQLPSPECRKTHLPEKLVFPDGTSWGRD